MHLPTIVALLALLVACGGDTSTRSGGPDAAGSGDVSTGETGGDVDLCAVDVVVCSDLGDIYITAPGGVECTMDCGGCVRESRSYPCGGVTPGDLVSCDAMSVDEFAAACRDACAEAGLCGVDCGAGASETHTTLGFPVESDIVMFRAEYQPDPIDCN